MKQETRSAWLSMACLGLFLGFSAGAAASERDGKAVDAHGVQASADVPGLWDLRQFDLGEQKILPWTVEFGLGAVPVPTVKLAALDVAALLEEDSRQMGGPLRVATNLQLDVLPHQGIWVDVPGGRLWMLDVEAEGAPGLRLHFSGVNLPQDVELEVFSPDHLDEQILRIGDQGPWQDGQFWTQTVRGSRARVECFVPAALADKVGNDLQLAIDEVAHFYRDVFEEEQMNGGEGGIAGVGACHNDTACFFPDWQNISDSVARILFTSGSGMAVCSGQLISTVAADMTPYFVTAEHCISTTAEANSAEVRWKYRRNTCAGAISNGSTTLFCTLLHAYCRSDHTLLMVEGTLPTPLFWTGYATSAPSSGTAVAAVHHPAGTQQRISFGTKSNTPQLCAGACANGATNYALVTWNDGVTEGGSSGGGIFRTNNQQLVGIVSCGSSSCANPTSPDTFGRFDRAHSGASLNGQPGGNWGNLYLQAGSDDTLEPNDSCAAATSISPGTYSNLVVKSVDEDWYHLTIPQSSGLTFTLQFTHSWGNINAQLYNACGGTIVASGTSSTNNETFSYTNPTSNSDFYLRVFLADDTRNTYNLIISTPTPANNTCANGTIIQSGSFPFSTLGATTTGFNETTQCNFNGFTNISNDIWYRYLATCNGDATIKVCNADFDAKIAVYGFACPTAAGQTIACADNGCGADGPSVTIPVLNNNVYRIRVGGVNGASGIGTLEITCGLTPPPPVCPSDINEDGIVNVDDLVSLLGVWGPCLGCLEDINKSGTVDVDDLVALLGAWGPCP